MFSDPDVYNADSDAYFSEAVAGTDNTYFPWLRLSRESDKLSELAQSIRAKPIRAKPIRVGAAPDGSLTYLIDLPPEELPPPASAIGNMPALLRAAATVRLTQDAHFDETGFRAGLSHYGTGFQLDRPAAGQRLAGPVAH